MSRLSRLRDLPLLWKLLVPFLAIIVVLGVTGGFFIVRNLVVQSQVALDQELTGRALDVRSAVRDREIYLVESANLASNLEGIAGAVGRGEASTADRLLQSVLALKTDLSLVAVTGPGGEGIAEFTRGPEGTIERSCCEQWAAHDLVAEALENHAGDKVAGLLRSDRGTQFAIAAPVCSGGERCAQVGVAIVGMDLDRIAAEALERSTPPGGEKGVAIHGADGALLARAGIPAVGEAPGASEEGTVRLSGVSDGAEVTTMYTPFHAGGRHLGSFGVSTPTAPAFAAARGTALRLALTLLLVMGGVIVIGLIRSHSVLRPIRSLLGTQRALGRGDLDARADVHAQDELGELSAGLNEMAEQLQAMYETLELRVAQRTEEVERLLQQRTELFAAVSHELRTPLAVVLRTAEMLLDPAYQRDGRWPSELAEALKDSGSQLTTLINDILDVAKAEAGGVEVDLRQVSLGDVLRELGGTIKALAASGGLRCTIRKPRALPHVLADPSRLRQMIINLVDNAVKYTPEGGSVEVKAGVRGEMVEVSVSDTGPGIPPEAAEHIFEPFYRARGPRAKPGQVSSGLGLAVVKRLVEAHGGTVRFTSGVGAGTTFTFTLQPAKAEPRGLRRLRAENRVRASA